MTRTPTTDRRNVNWGPVIEDLEFLADNKVGLTEAARRVGVKAETIDKRLPRLGYRDLAHRLRTHEPINLTTHNKE